MYKFPRFCLQHVAITIFCVTAILQSAASAVTVTDQAHAVAGNSMTFEFSLSGLSGQVAGANLMIAPQNVRVDVYGYSSAASVVNNPPAGTLLGSFNIGDTILAILDFINDLIPPPVPAPPDPIEIELIGLSLQSVGPWTPASSSPSVEIDLTSGPSDTIIVRVPGIPVPAALPLLASGLGVLGLLGWRRKRSGAA